MTGPPGGAYCPNFRPPTPKSELANSLRKITENEAVLGVNFNIVETGGLNMRSIMHKSNPLKEIGCDSQDCLPCKDGRGQEVIVRG